MTTRDRAALSLDEHTEQLAARRWWTVQQLAARWQVWPGTVRAIAYDELPYTLIGRQRRYRPDAVVAYEARTPVAITDGGQ